MANNAEIASTRAERFDSPKEKESPRFDVHELMKAYGTETIKPDRDNSASEVRELIFPDVFKPEIPNERAGERLVPPKMSDFIKPADPRTEGDKRDGDAMMDAMRSGRLDDLKNLVADMSPEKLKRVAEQLKAEGFDISGKDGKLTIFNKNLGVGVRVDQDGNAEVVRKDSQGNIVKAEDGTKPDVVLGELAKDLNTESTADIIKRMLEEEKSKERHLPHGISNYEEDYRPRVRPMLDLKDKERSHDGMLLL